MSQVDASRTRPLKCVVVGAGVIGATSAYRLALAGAEVTLVDADMAASGTSGASFAHVNVSYAGYWEYVELRRAGMAGYAALKQEDGGAPWWHDTGFLAVYRSGGDWDYLDWHAGRLRDLEISAVPVTEEPRTVEPALAPLDVRRSYLFSSEGWVDLRRMVVDLVSRGRRLGVEVRTNDPVTGMLRSGCDVTGVLLRSGTRIDCDQVIVCCGRWTDELLGFAGLETRFVAHDSAAGTPVPGLLVVTDAAPGSVTMVTAVDDINYRPESGGRTMLWSGVVDRELQRSGGVDAADGDIDRLADELLAAAARSVPALGAARVDQALVAMRALPSDGLPVMGRPPGIDGLYVALAHAAATMAPALAELIVDEVAGGVDDDRLDRFRLERLMSSRSERGREKENGHDYSVKR